MTPEQQLRCLHRSGTDDLATATALLRAAVDGDALAVSLVIRGLDPYDDDLTGVIVCLTRVGAAALIGGERGRDGAHVALDNLAALARDEAR